MNPPPMRTRPQEQAPAGSGWLRQGAGIAQMRQEDAQRQQERNDMRAAGIGGKGPFRFRLKKGEQRPVVILDVSIESGIGFREHNLKTPEGQWGHFEPCIMDTHNCPICAKFGQEGYNVVILTVLDLTGYDRKDQQGNVIEHVPHSRMLLPIKVSQIDKWLNLEAAAMQERGTLRGMYLMLKRGDDDKSVSIGEPQLVQGARMFLQYSEEELVANFGHPVVFGRDNKTVLKQENADITPFPYRTLFKEPDVADLNRRYGTVGVGNAAAAAAEFNQPTAARPGGAPPPGGTRSLPGGAPMPGGAPAAPAHQYPSAAQPYPQTYQQPAPQQPAPQQPAPPAVQQPAPAPAPAPASEGEPPPFS